MLNALFFIQCVSKDKTAGKKRNHIWAASGNKKTYSYAATSPVWQGRTRLHSWTSYSVRIHHSDREYKIHLISASESKRELYSRPQWSLFLTPSHAAAFWGPNCLGLVWDLILRRAIRYKTGHSSSTSLYGQPWYFWLTGLLNINHGIAGIPIFNHRVFSLFSNTYLLTVSGFIFIFLVKVGVLDGVLLY